MYVDTHAHLYLKHFKEDIEKVVFDAKKKGVEHIYLPNIDKASTAFMKELERRFPDYFSSMIGVHPGSIRDNYDKELEFVRAELEKGGYVAVGEIGTDLYWEENKKFRKEQVIAFEKQIDWAMEFGLPIVIHARESMDLTIEIVESKQNGQLRGVFHCFNGSIQQADRIMDLGFFMGIGGVLTYKNSGLKKVVSDIPLDFLILETDAPFLPPIPHRGRRNESAFIPIIAQHLSEVQNSSISEVAQITTKNAYNLFNRI